MLWSSTPYSGGVCKSSPSLSPKPGAQSQGIVAEFLSAKACPADWRVRNFAAKMDTVGEIINNANLAFSPPILTSGASHFQSQVPASMATRESRKTLGTRGAEAVYISRMGIEQGEGKDIPLQDSQLCLLLLEICPEQLTWVHSNLSPAPHCPLPHSGLS